MTLNRLETAQTADRLSATRHIVPVLLLFLSAAITPADAATGKLVGGQVSEHPDWFKESFLDISEDVAEADDDLGLVAAVQ